MLNCELEALPQVTTFSTFLNQNPQIAPLYEQLIISHFTPPSPAPNVLLNLSFGVQEHSSVLHCSMNYGIKCIWSFISDISQFVCTVAVYKPLIVDKTAMKTLPSFENQNNKALSRITIWG